MYTVNCQDSEKKHKKCYFYIDSSVHKENFKFNIDDKNLTLKIDISKHHFLLDLCRSLDKFFISLKFQLIYESNNNIFYKFDISSRISLHGKITTNSCKKIIKKIEKKCLKVFMISEESKIVKRIYNEFIGYFNNVEFSDRKEMNKNRNLLNKALLKREKRTLESPTIDLIEREDVNSTRNFSGNNEYNSTIYSPSFQAVFNGTSDDIQQTFNPLLLLPNIEYEPQTSEVYSTCTSEEYIVVTSNDQLISQNALQNAICRTRVSIIYSYSLISYSPLNVAHHF